MLITISRESQQSHCNVNVVSKHDVETLSQRCVNDVSKHDDQRNTEYNVEYNVKHNVKRNVARNVVRNVEPDVKRTVERNVKLNIERMLHAMSKEKLYARRSSEIVNKMNDERNKRIDETNTMLKHATAPK